MLYIGLIGLKLRLQWSKWTLWKIWSVQCRFLMHFQRFSISIMRWWLRDLDNDIFQMWTVENLVITYGFINLIYRFIMRTWQLLNNQAISWSQQTNTKHKILPYKSVFIRPVELNKILTKTCIKKITSMKSLAMVKCATIFTDCVLFYYW